jgi:methyl-accepting chemotaxis protein
MFGEKGLKNTLSFRFLRWIIPLLTLSFLLFGVTGFFVTRDSLVRFSRQSSNLLTDQTKVALVNWLQDQIYLAQTIAADPKIVRAVLNPTDEPARAEAHSYLQQLHDRYKYYENIPIAVRLPPGRTYSMNVNGEPRVIKNGTFLLDTVQGRTLGKCGPDFSYIKAIFEGAPYYISEVYPSILRGNPLFVVAAPVKHEGQVIGVTVLGVRMDYFTDLFIDPAKVGETGYLMMFDETGKVIAHPDKKLILNDAESKRIGKITERVLHGTDPSFFDTYEGVEKLYVVSRLAKGSFGQTGPATSGASFMRHDWYIVSGQPVAEIVKTSRTQAYLYLLFSVLLSAIIAVVLYKHTQRTITRPLAELTRATAEIVRSGDLTQKIDAHSQDEIGELSRTFNEMVEKLRDMATSLRQTLTRLREAVGDLDTANSQQRETITRQAAALQETQVTAQEIKQTSNMAAQKAEAVLKVTSEADEIGRSGEASIEQSLTWLTGIRSEAEEISTKIGELGTRARQIGNITQSVRDLADQSNMLALNAAIEAVRSGEHGKGFGVVAREIRNLADQSIQATHRVSDVLDGTTNAISAAIAISEKGSQKIDNGLTQMRSSGENLRRLSSIVRENSAAVRQIAAAVSQQDAGIAQIFGAVTELSKIVDDTIKRLESTDQAAEVVKSVTDQVSEIIKTYRV